MDTIAMLFQSELASAVSRSLKSSLKWTIWISIEKEVELLVCSEPVNILHQLGLLKTNEFTPDPDITPQWKTILANLYFSDRPPPDRVGENSGENGTMVSSNTWPDNQNILSLRKKIKNDDNLKQSHCYLPWS